MYDILIVEDEEIILEGISRIVSNSQLGFDKVLTASNFNDAMMTYKKYYPKFVVTDINLPTQNGLELIESMQQYNRGTKFIIISGFDSFRYAKQAIHLGVVEYMLKPIDPKELVHILRHLIESNEKNDGVWSQDTGIIKNGLEPDFLTNSNTSTLKPDKSNFPMPTSYLYVAILTDEPINLKPACDHLISFLTGNAKFEITGETDISQGLVLFTFSGNCEAIYEQLKKKVIEYSAEYKALGNKVYLSISPPFQERKDYYEFSQRALSALDKRFFTQEFIFFSEKEAFVSIPDNLLSISENLFLSIKSNSPDEVKKDIFKLFSAISAGNAADILLRECLMLIAKKTEEFWNLDSGSICSYVESILKRTGTLRDLQFTYTQHILNLMEQRRPIIENAAVRFAINYMNDNFEKNITLTDISNAVLMNYNYFSAMFKKHTGISVMHYLQKIRIEKSITLLKKPQYKIYEVALLVGFQDDKYFSKVFKKITGKTPIEYRNLLDYK